MHRIASLTSLAGLGLAISCSPLTQSEGGVKTDCNLPTSQVDGELRLDCRIAGEPEPILLNPLDPSDRSCGPNSIALFNQSVEAGATMIYGENGFDDPGRVRIGVDLASSGTHNGTLAKSVGNGCQSTTAPAFSVNTSFGGRHVAIIDKEPRPMCVYTSRLSLAPFSQSIELGLNFDVSDAARAGTEAAIARQIDLEIALAVNGLLASQTELDEAFYNRAGRCEGHYWPYTGE